MKDAIEIFASIRAPADGTKIVEILHFHDYVHWLVADVFMVRHTGIRWGDDIPLRENPDTWEPKQKTVRKIWEERRKEIQLNGVLVNPLDVIKKGNNILVGDVEIADWIWRPLMKLPKTRGTLTCKVAPSMLLLSCDKWEAIILPVNKGTKCNEK
jgi:hypothetical protein